MKYIYLIIFTDKWGEDYCAQEAWIDEKTAKKRCYNLNKKMHEGNKERESWFYIVKKMEVDKELAKER